MAESAAPRAEAGGEGADISALGYRICCSLLVSRTITILSYLASLPFPMTSPKRRRLSDDTSGQTQAAGLLPAKVTATFKLRDEALIRASRLEAYAEHEHIVQEAAAGRSSQE